MSNAANGNRVMTLKQKQALLSYLGYYDGPIDGIWGGKSQRATIDFQRDCMDSADGIFGAATQARILEVIVSGMPPKETPPDWWREIRHFRREEFRCPCGRCGGFPAEPEETLVRLAEEVREHFGAPAVISSGVRCQAHNDALPGSVPNSRHLTGKAIDFCIRGVSGAALLKYVKTLPVRYAYQIDGCDFVHMDVE